MKDGGNIEKGSTGTVLAVTGSNDRLQTGRDVAAYRGADLKTVHGKVEAARDDIDSAIDAAAAMLNDPELARRWFNPVHNAIADLIGVPATLAIIRDYGGGHVYVARNAARSSLARRYGREVAEALSEQFGGAKVHIPQGPFSGAGRIRFIGLELFRRGWSVNMVAHSLRASLSQAKLWKREA